MKMCTACEITRAPHRNLRTRRRMSSQKWMTSLVRQDKFKVGVVPADGLGRLLLVFLNWGSLAIKTGG
jgi:hypothetical protein